MKFRTMNSDTAEEGERAASLLSSIYQMCGNNEKADELAAVADVLGKRCIQASGAEERSMSQAEGFTIGNGSKRFDESCTTVTISRPGGEEPDTPPVNPIKQQTKAQYGMQLRKRKGRK